MREDFIHSIPESSCFFQGHIGQFFSRKFGKYLSFQITYNDKDILDDFNIEKYIPIFSKLINKKIALRMQDGGNFHEVSPDDITIKTIKLIDDVEEEGPCGQFKIYPPTAICLKDGCNQYFEIDKGRKCGHKDTDPWEQFTFLAFCDECGRYLPLHYMTNINDDCKKCGAKASLTKIKWTRGKDNISSYKVLCNKCGHEYGLYFYECDHTIRATEECLSTRKPKRFTGVPARAGAIVHPFVISIPDLSHEDNNGFQRKNGQRMLLSDSFAYFFNYQIDESKLDLPEFKEKLLNETAFWNLSKVTDLLDDISDDLNIDHSNNSEMTPNQFDILIKRILKEAKTRIDDGADESKIKERYGIIHIKNALESVKEIDFEEHDVQCSNLISSKSCNRKVEPVCKPNDYEALCESVGFAKIFHFADLTMIQALLGIIEGSTRRNPVLFRAIETGKTNHKKTTIFVRKYPTEGILFQLQHEKIIRWLHENKQQIGFSSNLLTPNGTDTYTHFRTVLLNDEICKNAVKKLLHTYSHMLIQQSTIDTGLDVQSLSEIICPYTGSIFLFSTNSINIGGLEFTYDYHLVDWFSRVKELAEDCPQDPGCMLDEGGACNSCSYIPEFVCYNFNQDLDRSTLIGGSNRFAKGYLQC